MNHRSSILALALASLIDPPDTCPRCQREKAHSADDCATGKCPKWWAICDKEARADCEAFASDPAYREKCAAYQRARDKNEQDEPR